MGLELSPLKPCLMSEGSTLVCGVLVEPERTSFQSWNEVTIIFPRGILADRLARGLSPMWAAPEVLKDATATPHSDIFSFGVLIIDMLTERRQPFQGL